MIHSLRNQSKSIASKQPQVGAQWPAKYGQSFRAGAQKGSAISPLHLRCWTAYLTKSHQDITEEAVKEMDGSYGCVGSDSFHSFQWDVMSQAFPIYLYPAFLL